MKDSGVGGRGVGGGRYSSGCDNSMTWIEVLLVAAAGDEVEVRSPPTSINRFSGCSRTQ